MGAPCRPPPASTTSGWRSKWGRGSPPCRLGEAGGAGDRPRPTGGRASVLAAMTKAGAPPRRRGRPRSPQDAAGAQWPEWGLRYREFSPIGSSPSRPERRSHQASQSWTDTPAHGGSWPSGPPMTMWNAKNHRWNAWTGRPQAGGGSAQQSPGAPRASVRGGRGATAAAPSVGRSAAETRASGLWRRTPLGSDACPFGAPGAARSLGEGEPGCPDGERRAQGQLPHA
jgi:hypothetical protein